MPNPVSSANDLKRELLAFEANAKRIQNSIINFNKVGKDKQTQALVEGRAKLLETCWEEVQRSSQLVEFYADDEARASLAFFTQSLLQVVESQYLEVYDFFQEKLAAFKPAVAGVSSVPPNASVHRQDNTSTDFKLPTIRIPAFSGKVTDWVSFRDLFVSLVISRTNLSNVQKLHYLLSVVTDDAAKLIAHIALADNNFDVAWNILKDHYENERSIINAHLSNFFAIKAVTGSDTVNGLKMLRASSSESINALRALKRPVDTWNDILVFCIVQRLDKNSRREWEVYLGDDTDYPTLDRLVKFMDTRIRSLEAAASVQSIDKVPDYSSKNSSRVAPKVVRSHYGLATESKTCVLCSGSHKLPQCEKFKAKSIPERQKYVRQNHLCINCLIKGHMKKDCRSTFNCFHCGSRHHSLLHEAKGDQSCQGTQAPSSSNYSSKSSKPSSDLNAKSNVSEMSDASSTHSHVSMQSPTSKQTVLLATAWVQLESEQGRRIHVRALIDPGSDASFVSESIVQSLRLHRHSTNSYVTSIGGNAVSTIKAIVPLLVSALHVQPEIKLKFNALVLPKITAYMPAPIGLVNVEWTRGLILADPEPISTAPIELLLGADLYANIILEGIRKETSQRLIMQNTIFGWILSGAYSTLSTSSRAIRVHHASAQDINSDLLQFFEVEEVPSRKCLTAAETQCEEYFKRTHYRTQEGRYVVRLPFTSNLPIAIGDTESVARASFYHLERRLQRDEELNRQYSAFLSEYQESKHMERANDLKRNTQTVYLPHHPVIKDSTTTKVRVVFNASAPSSNGSTLNDHLLPGPNLQTDLVSVILSWRMFRYVFTADIAQMFRQILVDPRDRSLQMILWRSSPNEELQSFLLNTVTYGTACAPFLAQRVVLQVAEDEVSNFPLAAPILKRHRYMDDLMFGDDSRDRVTEKRLQVTACLARAGFLLRKWASNDASLLKAIDSTNHGLALDLPFKEGSKLKVLGLNWHPDSDSFRIVTLLPTCTSPTKRHILSLIARCFDPLGWVAPVVVTPKILVQKLWVLKIGWDDPVPEPIADSWRIFCEQLACLNQISIPRWSGNDSSSTIHIHGFCDASEQAYAAVTYLLVRSADSKVQVQLMLAKTRVAPLKTLTMPRLELCAAVLLTRCILTLLASIEKPIESINCWSDSSVVLCWLKKPPSSLKIFTAHRIAEIQRQLPQAKWRHVPSDDNPADCASRGLTPYQFSRHSLWWNGPPWLIGDLDFWPDQDFLNPMSTEIDCKVTHAHLQVINTSNETHSFRQLSQKAATWSRLLRITAYILRFIARCRKTNLIHSSLGLQAQEIRVAETLWIRHAQADVFAAEFTALSRKTPLPSNSKLKKLDPYLDDSGLIRVGGRLQLSELPTGQKHPVVLSKHRISHLLIEHVHKTTLHGGLQLMLRVLRENYWIFQARNLIRFVLIHCVTCTRERAAHETQFMANLPRSRIIRSRPFSHSGVDYAGPFLVRNSAGRGHSSHKTYIALFICLATRAIHLELVHDYSSAAFVAAFQRFSARRGLPTMMYSDNGTTFQGAEKELREAFKLVLQEVNVQNLFASDQVSWKFLPPSAPHFGGLWEAGVKSVKHHLRRILKASTPTAEEFTTLLCNVEACLNSRPIAPLSDDLTSYDVLTPGHFLVGSALKSVPMPSTLHLNENRLDRWRTMRRKLEQFWRLWSNDYLHALQQRSKWQTRQPNIQVGDLVLLRNDTLPPAKWELARVLECFPDSEGLVRSARIKTASSVYIRPIVKLCKLPVPTQENSISLSHESVTNV